MCVRCLGGEGLGVDILGSPKIGIVYEILWDFMGFHGTSDWDLVKRIIRDEGGNLFFVILHGISYSS